MRKMRKNFKRPKAPWNSTLIGEERKLIKEFGLKNKSELWKAREVLREYRGRAREITARRDDEDRRVLLEKLVKFNILNKSQGIDDVLALSVEDVLNRRLQTLIYRKNMANTIRQARQFIVHGHVKINGRKVIFPSYFVPENEEGMIEVSKAVKEEPVKPAPPKKEPKKDSEKPAKAEGREQAEGGKK